VKRHGLQALYVGHPGKMLHIEAVIGRAPVEGFLDGKGTYSECAIRGMRWVGQRCVVGQSGRLGREDHYNGACIECISANPILRTQTMEKRVSLTGGGGCI